MNKTSQKYSEFSNKSQSLLVFSLLVKGFKNALINSSMAKSARKRDF
jgi:hypothetical protein